jgi:hypothetical protein
MEPDKPDEVGFNILSSVHAGLLQVSAGAIPALQLGANRFQRHPQKGATVLCPTWRCHPLSKLDQQMYTLKSLSQNDGHLFDRQSDRFKSKAYEWPV